MTLKVSLTSNLSLCISLVRLALDKHEWLYDLVRNEHQPLESPKQRRGLFYISDLSSFVCCSPRGSRLTDASKGKRKRKQQQTPSLATAKELVSTKRQGVTKQVKRLQGRQGPGKSKATVKDKRIKSAVGQSVAFFFFFRLGEKLILFE